MIEAYIEGRLSEEQNLRVRSLLSTDPDFLEEFNLYNTIVDGIRSEATEALREEMKKADIKLDLTNESIRSKGRSYPMIAAVLLLFFLATSTVYFINSGRRIAAIQQVYVEDPGLPVTMNAESKTILDNAMSYYKTGDTDKGLVLLKELSRNLPQNDTVRYYMGVLLLKSGHPSLAVKEFEFVLQPDITSVFKKDAEYRIAFAFWMQNKKSEAKHLFRQIKDNPLHPYHQAAVNALEILE